MYERVATQSAVMKKNFIALQHGANYWSLLIPLVVASVLWILIAAGGYAFERRELELPGHCIIGSAVVFSKPGQRKLVTPRLS